MRLWTLVQPWNNLKKKIANMSYKISFYGARNPETIGDTSGEQLYKDYASKTLPERVEIRDGLTVERKSIREVEKIYTAVERRDYSITELRQFEEDKLVKFLNEKGELGVWGKWCFLRSEKLVNATARVKEPKTDSDVSVVIYSHMIGEYERMKEKINQWQSWKGRGEYAKRMKAQQLAKTADHV